MIRIIYQPRKGASRTDLRVKDLAKALQDSKSVIWLDILDEPPEVCFPILRDTFGFHPLAIQDALEEAHVPKVDDWMKYVYLVLHSVVFDAQRDTMVATQELDIFLGSNYLVTFRHHDIPALERVWASCLRDERYLVRGTTHMVYRLADELVADYMPVVEQVDETFDGIEDVLFSRPEPALLEQIFSLKRALLHLRRIMIPQREVLNKLARGDFKVIDEGERIFFRDVYDHLVRLHDITEGLRDLVGGALETYLSLVSN